MTDTKAPATCDDYVTFRYTNYRGETSERKAMIISLWFGDTDWHPDPQWFIQAFDHGKGSLRDFALRDCDFTTRADLSAAERDKALDEVLGLLRDNPSFDSQICCNGYQCGCQGATVFDYLEYQIRALKLKETP